MEIAPRAPAARSPDVVRRPHVTELPAITRHLTVAYYPELDPSTGRDQREANLPAIVDHIAQLLLWHDVVIVPPENLFDHHLALPAFEALAPFVLTGRLTTTTDPSILRPVDLVLERARLHAEERPRPPQALGQVSAARSPLQDPAACHRRDAIALTVDRWLALWPDKWTLQRDVTAQIAAFAAQLELDCLEHPDRPGARLLREAIDRARQSNAPPTHTALLAKLTSERSRALPRALAHAALAIHVAYFELGARTHRSIPGASGPGRTCHVFPGRFARFLRDRGLVQPASGSPYDWDLLDERLAARWRRAGLAPDLLSSLSADALFQIATSDEWLALRPLLCDDGSPPELVRDAAAKLASAAGFRDALGRLERRSHAGPAPVLLPSPWQLAAQAHLGLHVPEPPPASHVELDLRTCVARARPDGPAATLRPSEALLLALLSLGGDEGVMERDVKQLVFDTAQLDAQPDRWLTAWKPQTQERDALDSGCRNRINVRKARANEALRPLGLRIDRERGSGVWRLVHERGAEPPLHLTGTAWDLVAPRCALPGPGAPDGEQASS
jgi:hypothetical protein